MKTLRDIPHLQGVKVLVRADFNVPLKGSVVADDFRIRTTLATIDFLRARGAKIILVSHLESNEGENLSLEPIAQRLTGLKVPVVFLKQMRGAYEYINQKMEDGDCILLENLRMNEGEKENDAGFAQELASLADVYVNEAFSVSHREHASIVSVPKIIPGYAGIQFEKEVSTLSRAFTPAHPFVFVLGGAKFETKLPLVSRFIELADTVFVGGALANDLLKAKGNEIGVSLLSKSKLDFSGFIDSPKLMIPDDVVDQTNAVKAADAVGIHDKIVDAGPHTLRLLREKIASAKFILWNGPLGMYEQGCKAPTWDLARMIAEATIRGAETIVGGGDTLAAISTLGIQHEFTFISTGGGAMLDFLAKGTLPGIEALK